MIITVIVLSIFALIVILLYTAFLTLFERKTLAALQKRKGPNVVGVAGILQAVADGVKLFSKETMIPARANKRLFMFAPIIIFFLSLAGWAVLPFFHHS